VSRHARPDVLLCLQASNLHCDACRLKCSDQSEYLYEGTCSTCSHCVVTADVARMEGVYTRASCTELQQAYRGANFLKAQRTVSAQHDDMGPWTVGNYGSDSQWPACICIYVQLASLHRDRSRQSRLSADATGRINPRRLIHVIESCGKHTVNSVTSDLG
jgi:hypothetical protein